MYIDTNIYTTHKAGQGAQHRPTVYVLKEMSPHLPMEKTLCMQTSSGGKYLLLATYNIEHNLQAVQLLQPLPHHGSSLISQGMCSCDQTHNCYHTTPWMLVFKHT